MGTVHLTRALIVDSALEILDSFGLGDMTMRRVATHLGVAPGALYWHIANKQELVSAIAQEILAPVTQPGDRRSLSDYCRHLREALLSRRDGAELIASALAQPSSPLRVEIERQLRDVIGAGKPGAATGAQAILHLLLGACVQEQSRRQFADLAGGGDGASISETIDAQVALLLAGITATGAPSSGATNPPVGG